MRSLLFVLLFLCGSAQAATHYIRDGGTASTSGTGSCTGWATANACDQLPSTLVRGDTYCFADGSYNSATLDTANSGTTVITIRKAVDGDGTCDQGANWVSTYGDGQATIGSFLLGSDYWVIDGVHRDETNAPLSWATKSAYGIATSGVTANTSITPNVCASNITVQYLDIGGSDIGNTWTGSEGAGIYHGGFDEFCLNWTISRVRIHNTGSNGTAPLHMNGSDGGTIEYAHISNSFGKEALRGQIAFKNYTVRYNWFENSCQADPGDPTSGCTGEIAAWDGSAGNWDNNEVYGNVILKTTSEANHNGSIIIGGDNGVSFAGPPGNNNKVYNNTIVGITADTANIFVFSGTGNECRNNLGYNLAGTWSISCAATSSNQEVSSDPFNDVANKDLTLSADTATTWTSLGSPYNTDMLGNTRTSSIGAFQYTTGGEGEPLSQRLPWLWLTGFMLTTLGGGIFWRNYNGTNNPWNGNGGAPASAREVGGWAVRRLAEPAQKVS